MIDFPKLAQPPTPAKENKEVKTFLVRINLWTSQLQNNWAMHDVWCEILYTPPPHPPDVEIMVHLGILVTRKYFCSQKILAEITAILSRILLCCECDSVTDMAILMQKLLCEHITYTKIHYWKIKQCLFFLITLPQLTPHLHLTFLTEVS